LGWIAVLGFQAASLAPLGSLKTKTGKETIPLPAALPV
jgi:hypothetical protein